MDINYGKMSKNGKICCKYLIKIFNKSNLVMKIVQYELNSFIKNFIMQIK